MSAAQATQASGEIRFGTDGWRDLMTSAFTPENVDLVARAVVELVRSGPEPERGLVVGYDTRDNSRLFAEICAARAIEAGIPAWLPARAIPTPLTAYSIVKLGTAGAFMITASHNPSAYNGIKFISDKGGPSSPEVTVAIEELILSLLEDGTAPLSESERATLASRAHALDLFDDYRRHLSTLVDMPAIRAAAPKVAVDAMYGAAHGMLSEILRDDLGCDVIAIHDFADPTFGGSMPDPSPSHLGELRDTVLGGDCLIGMALDGDGDRFGVIDRSGAALIPNQVLCVLADYLLDRGAEGDIVRTVATTHLLDRIASAHGRGCVETPVGFKWIAAQMLSSKVLIGGEESGGLSIIGHIPEKDGLLADLLLLELAVKCDGALMGRYNALLEKHGHHASKRFDLELPLDRKDALLMQLRDSPPSELGGERVAEVRTADGVKLLLDNGDWVLFRPSGTEPLVRIYVESVEQERFERLSAAALALADG